MLHLSSYVTRTVAFRTEGIRRPIVDCLRVARSAITPFATLDRWAVCLASIEDWRL